MSTQYEIVTRKFWKKKGGFSGPDTVSFYGAMPNPREAYYLVERGYSIYNTKNNTYSNYFFGKIGIDTLEEANKIIEKLTKK